MGKAEWSIKGNGVAQWLPAASQHLAAAVAAGLLTCRGGWHSCHLDPAWTALARTNLSGPGRDSQSFPSGWRPGSTAARDCLRYRPEVTKGAKGCRSP